MTTSVLDKAPAAHAHPQTGIWSWITTVDHKRIGILYGATAFIFFLLGGLEALFMRIQLMKPNNTFIDPDTFNALFTMHGTTMIFLGVMPLSAMVCHSAPANSPASTAVSSSRLTSLASSRLTVSSIMLSLISAPVLSQ